MKTTETNPEEQRRRARGAAATIVVAYLVLEAIVLVDKAITALEQAAERKDG